MSFYTEILRTIGFGEMTTALDYNIINYGGKAVYVDGLTGILKIEQEQIALDTKKAIIEIDGNLSISLLEEKSIIIKGKIQSIQVRDKDEKERKKKK